MSAQAPTVAIPRLRRLPLGRWGLRGIAFAYLGIGIALPLAAVLNEGFTGGLTNFREAMSSPGAWSAIRLTFITATVAAVINAVFGTLLAYVLVRFRFPGRGLLSAIVDVPFAIPTLVTGVMLAALYGPASPIGGFLADKGIQVIFAPLGILLALMFVTLPFVIRTVQPVLTELDVAEEEAAYSLGAGGWTTFRRVVLPALRPAITAGTLLAFARGLGEFGAVVIVSGNIVGKTLTAPYFIYQLTNQFRPDDAAAVASVLFLFSFALVLATDRLLARKGSD
jgi:sulfate/thiosulfate transport system permease protein